MFIVYSIKLESKCPTIVPISIRVEVTLDDASRNLIYKIHFGQRSTGRIHITKIILHINVRMLQFCWDITTINLLKQYPINYSAYIQLSCALVDPAISISLSTQVGDQSNIHISEKQNGQMLCCLCLPKILLHPGRILQKIRKAKWSKAMLLIPSKKTVIHVSDP